MGLLIFRMRRKCLMQHMEMISRKEVVPHPKRKRKKSPNAKPLPVIDDIGVQLPVRRRYKLHRQELSPHSTSPCNIASTHRTIPPHNTKFCKLYYSVIRTEPWSPIHIQRDKKLFRKYTRFPTGKKPIHPSHLPTPVEKSNTIQLKRL